MYELRLFVISINPNFYKKDSVYKENVETIQEEPITVLEEVVENKFG
jgi:hypothetical protein